MAASMRSCVCRQFKAFTNLNYNSKRFATYIPIYRAHFNHRSVSEAFGVKFPFWTQTSWRPISVSSTLLSSEQATVEKEEDKEEDYHSIIKDTERGKGPADKHEFQAETRKLLDIVAKSLYSEKEVFIRELISNASDALEKFRYLQLQGTDMIHKDEPLEIHIATDENKKTFTIQDTGVGLTKEELIENIGTIAKSGSKAFIEQMANKADVSSSLIGQFGVGFYSTFMVGDSIEVFTLSYKPGSAPLRWTSSGTGSYEISEAEGVQRGTKIVVHLKGDCYDFAKEEVIKEIVKKYSNFVGVPIYLNGKKINVVEALWMLDPKSITEDMHEEFYRFISNSFDKPRYHLHYKADAPLNIRALFYIPEYKPTLFEMSRETDVSLTLYSKKVMILQKANNILPKWLRFVKGVVDSEDIPLNLSRELLQDSALIRKLRLVLTNRILKFLIDQSKKDTDKYLKFYEDYGLFLREGIVTTMEQDQREDIARLMRFESSKFPEGVKVSLDEYASRMKAGTREIYFLSAPSRQLAESSPYFEALKNRDREVLFLYEPYDELVLLNLNQFDKKTLKSIENEVADKDDSDKVDSKDENSLSQSDITGLMEWMKGVLGGKVNKIKITQRLHSHPCLVTVVEMGSARHFLRTSLADKSPEEKYRLLQPTLELNPSHPLIKKLNSLSTSDSDLATLLAEQLFENAMINAGLVDDTRGMVQRLHELLEKALRDK